MAVPLPNGLLIGLAYLLPAFAIAADRRGAGPWVRRLAPLGQLTYSMYLIHGLVITAALNAIADKLLHLRGVAMIGATALSWLAVLMLSRWSLAWFETPARDAINALPLVRRHHGRPPAPLGAGG